MRLQHVTEQLKQVVNTVVFDDPKEDTEPDDQLNWPEAVNTSTTEIDTITYKSYNPRYKGTLETGYDFVPTHEVVIQSHNERAEDKFKKTTFGIRPDGVVIRNHHASQGVLVSRSLTLEETKALVDFAADPLGNASKREVILKLTEEEEREVQEDLKQRQVERESLVIDLSTFRKKD